ncbi:single-stranded-DNA-specific exonuclease RecJ, partial [Acinetobacter baumannii]
AMAAGLTLREDGFDEFVATFEAVGREWLTEALLSRVLETDGEADPECFSPQFVERLETQVWGQGFPAPSFCGEFDVLSQAVLKDKHLKLK